jgi:hypothetical protein
MKRQQNKPHLSTQLAPMIDGESSMLLPSINLFGPSSRVEIPRKLTLDETQFSWLNRKSDFFATPIALRSQPG